MGTRSSHHYWEPSVLLKVSDDDARAAGMGHGEKHQVENGEKTRERHKSNMTPEKSMIGDVIKEIRGRLEKRRTEDGRDMS